MRRREFVSALGLTTAAALAGLGATPAEAEPPPETARLRLVRTTSICQAPQYVAEELLRAEGFTDIRYIPKKGPQAIDDALASGQADVNMHFSGPLILRIDEGAPIVMLAGVHPGCYELFGTDRVRTISDLKRKTIGIRGLGGPEHVFLASMLAYVGLDPRTDVRWEAHDTEESIALLAAGRIDAFMGFPPDPQELRARKIGHVVVNSNVDRPWSQYFCCMLAGHREFVRKHPVATKRALRAILKASTICSAEPEQAARVLVDGHYTTRYDWALQAIKEISYSRWRDYDPEDTIRFYGLRLHESGMVKSNPKKIIAEGSDWRFINELKRELKG
ncbi:MAG TPA: ABC transporter substrate-binding protein [Candidatus Methylomirabilis sp.]|nr:ABC transporter substrate-binding protein [Candidatus Methylomirabilis sp.]